jgi:hypothetical protein
MRQQDAVSEQVRDRAVMPVECDVPLGWSLDDWRTVRGLAREVVMEPARPLWRRILRLRLD